MLKNKCCLYVVISIRFFSITVCNLLIDFPSYSILRHQKDWELNSIVSTVTRLTDLRIISSRGRRFFFSTSRPRCGGTWQRKWECLNTGESNGKLPLRTGPGCSVPEPYRSHDWALVSAQTSPRAK